MTRPFEHALSWKFSQKETRDEEFGLWPTMFFNQKLNSYFFYRKCCHYSCSSVPPALGFGLPCSSTSASFGLPLLFNLRFTWPTFVLQRPHQCPLSSSVHRLNLLFIQLITVQLACGSSNGFTKPGVNRLVDPVRNILGPNRIDRSKALYQRFCWVRSIGNLRLDPWIGWANYNLHR
jgi:hypothetical protein